MNNKALVVGSLVAVSALSWFASKAYYDDKRNHEVESLREVLKTTERHIHALRDEINSLKSKLSEGKPVEETKEDSDIPAEETAETESEDIPDERENISYRSTGNYTDYSKYYKPGVIKIPNIRVGWETVNNDIKVPYEEPGPITEDEFYEGANEDDWIRTTYSFYAGDRVFQLSKQRNFLVRNSGSILVRLILKRRNLLGIVMLTYICLLRLLSTMHITMTTRLIIQA